MIEDLESINLRNGPKKKACQDKNVTRLNVWCNYG